MRLKLASNKGVASNNKVGPYHSNQATSICLNISLVFFNKRGDVMFLLCI